MKNLFRKFQKMLLVELEDLHEDLDLFIQVIKDRHESRLITDYVYRENLAILRNEVLGLEDCSHGCEDLDLDELTSVDEMAAFLKLRLKQRLISRGYAQALYTLLEKRLDRIAGYLRQEEVVDVVPR